MTMVERGTRIEISQEHGRVVTNNVSHTNILIESLMEYRTCAQCLA
jgi:hypothetical protein